MSVRSNEQDVRTICLAPGQRQPPRRGANARQPAHWVSVSAGCGLLLALTACGSQSVCDDDDCDPAQQQTEASASSLGSPSDSVAVLPSDTHTGAGGSSVVTGMGSGSSGGQGGLGHGGAGGQAGAGGWAGATADGGIAGAPVLPPCEGCECSEHFDCRMPYPVCSPETFTCIQCFDDTHQGCTQSKPWCKAGELMAENRCVECRSNADCSDPTLPACEQDQCVACSSVDDLGCAGDTPRCKPDAVPDGNVCVECLTNADCSSEFPVCEGNQCVPCTVGSDQGCGDEAARCLAGVTPKLNRCVQCLDAEDCGVDTPACSPEHSCVQCLAPADCRDPNAPHCDAQGSCTGCQTSADCTAFAELQHCEASTGACVVCAENEHCTTADAARCAVAEAPADADGGAAPGPDNSCAPCEQDADCSHIAGQNVCLDGACVACSTENASACSGNACDSRPGPEQWTCSQAALNSAGTCAECVSDAQCEAGRKCLPVQKNSTQLGHYCLWQEGAENGKASCFDDAAPYVVKLNATSLDGVQGSFCWLAYSTCQSLADFTRECTEDANCGADNVEDGLCREVEVSEVERCTLRCASDKDCNGTRCNTGDGWCSVDPL